MTCRDVHRELSRSDRTAGEYSALASAHCRVCADCAELAHAVEQARRSIAGDRNPVQPDANFSARVLERIGDQEPGWSALEWAATRFLPFAAALLLTLAVWQASLGPQASIESLIWGSPNDDQLIAFLLSDTEP